MSLWLNSGVPATEVARRAGHGVAVLLKIYAHCIDGQADAANQRITDALGMAEPEPGPGDEGDADDARAQPETNRRTPARSGAGARLLVVVHRASASRVVASGMSGARWAGGCESAGLLVGYLAQGSSGVLRPRLKPQWSASPSAHLGYAGRSGVALLLGVAAVCRGTALPLTHVVWANVGPTWYSFLRVKASREGDPAFLGYECDRRQRQLGGLGRQPAR